MAPSPDVDPKSGIGTTRSATEYVSIFRLPCWRIRFVIFKTSLSTM